MRVLNINDIFWTFQGEGTHAGRRALFVRMPFCNLACSWCDTFFNTFDTITEEEFTAFASIEPTRFAVITGGEPTMNKHTPLVIELLTKLGFEIAIETNGTFPIPEGIDFVTVSPKQLADFDVNPQAYERASEFKYVVDDAFDFALLDRHENDLPGKTYRLSPEFNNMEKNVGKITDYIKRNPRWKLNLQTHKWLGIQ